MGRLTTVVLIILILNPMACLQAEADRQPSIVTNSPFLPPGFQPPGGNRSADEPPPASSSEYEFRGVYQLGGEYYYNLYNRRERTASWMTDHEALQENVRIVSFDPGENLLVVDIGGEQSSLSLIETSNKPMPIQSAPRRQVAQASAKKNTPEARRPVRRRVIRPSVRTSSNTAAAAAARRRVINRRKSNQ